MSRQLPMRRRQKLLRRILEQRLRRIRHHPVWGEVYELIDGSIGDYARDHGPMYAAAVAFYGLLSLVPLVVLFASVGGYFIHSFGVDDASIDVLVAEVVAQFRRAVPYIRPDFAEDIKTLVEARQELGLVGAVVLLGTASLVFRGLEYSFARIFSRSNASRQIENDRPRNVVLSKLLFGAFVTAVFASSMLIRFVWGMVSSIAEHQMDNVVDLRQWVGEGSLMGSIWESALLVLIYAAVLKAFTHEKVQMRFALYGGLLFLSLFVGARKIYEFYLDGIANLGAVYGSLAALMTVVLWVFYLSTIVLICGYFTRTLQRRVLFGRRYPPTDLPDVDAA